MFLIIGRAQELKLIFAVLAVRIEVVQRSKGSLSAMATPGPFFDCKYLTPPRGLIN